jgi:antitoxin MazE
MRTRIQKWGNSLALRIPRTLAVDARLEDGTEVDLRVEDGRVVVTAVRGELSLDEMLDRVTPENRHGLIDWGPGMGNEAW